MAATRAGQNCGVPEQSYVLAVSDVRRESPDTVSLVLDVPDELAEVFAFAPGQFLTIAIPSHRIGLAQRAYSICTAPDEPLTITVRRTPDGFGSAWVHEHVRPGSRLRVLPPSGVFTPDDLDADLLLLAAGSGITPGMSIIRAALRDGRGRVVLVYANREAGSVIFADDLAALEAAHPDRLRVVHWLESERGLPTQEALLEVASEHAGHDAFVCGPPPFVRLAMAALKDAGFPRSRRHQERFVSLDGNPFGDEPAVAGPVAVEVELAGEQHSWDDWSGAEPLLEFLESKGLAAPYSCRQGECSSCAVRLLEGEVTLGRNETLDEEDLAAGYRLACQARAATEKLRVSYDR